MMPAQQCGMLALEAYLSAICGRDGLMRHDTSLQLGPPFAAMPWEAAKAVDLATMIKA